MGSTKEGISLKNAGQAGINAAVATTPAGIKAEGSSTAGTEPGGTASSLIEPEELLPASLRKDLLRILENADEHPSGWIDHTCDPAIRPYTSMEMTDLDAALCSMWPAGHPLHDSIPLLLYAYMKNSGAPERQAAPVELHNYMM